MHGLTLGDVLREHARRYPDRTAVVCGDDRYTWPELDERVNRLANALTADGFAPGDRVLWLGQNCHRLLEGLLAAAKLGGIFCPVNWRQSPEELAFVVDDVDAHTVIWQETEIGPAVREARGGSKARWVQHDGSEYEALLASGRADDPTADVDPASSVLMMYTAAFSGRPNGALLSHRAIITQDLVMGPLQDVDSDYVYLNCGPLFHIATFMTTLATFHFGGRNVFTRRVEAEALCRLIHDERPTAAFLMPPTMAQMKEVNAGGRYDLSSIRRDSKWDRNPAGYGQTEVMGMLTLNVLGGRPSVVVQVRVVDPDLGDVPIGETGEIVARGPTVCNGYWNRPELNERRFRGGWWHTSDLGRREPDGAITFIGPMTRIVKSAAENIYPAEVEGCLRSHPAVADAAIIGVPDPVWTQNVKAVVVLKDGGSASAEDIIEHCRERIASYKKPKTVEFVDALPRVGFAVDYEALDARFGGGGYPGSG